MTRALLLLATLAALGARAEAPEAPLSDAACAPLPDAPPEIRTVPGETLELALDALGARAGKMSLRVLPPSEGTLPVELRAESNAFFSKIRRLQAKAISRLDPARIRPRRYVEDSLENGIRRTADVTFTPEDHRVDVRYTIGEREGSVRYRAANDALDGLSTLYALRRLPFREGMPLCMDVYGIRRLWRLSGNVVGREHISIGLGEFDTWHLQGVAVRLDDPSHRREVHVWISDDARRLPLVLTGSLELGVVRATLEAFRRPGEKAQRAQRKSDLKW